jgi:hypothetical protein
MPQRQVPRLQRIAPRRSTVRLGARAERAESGRTAGSSYCSVCGIDGGPQHIEREFLRWQCQERIGIRYQAREVRHVAAPRAEAMYHRASPGSEVETMPHIAGLEAPQRSIEPPGIQEPSPCDDCRFRQRCGPEQLACDRFSMFCRGLPKWRWQSAPTAPTRARFAALFG